MTNKSVSCSVIDCLCVSCVSISTPAIFLIIACGPPLYHLYEGKEGLIASFAILQYNEEGIFIIGGILVVRLFNRDVIVQAAHLQLLLLQCFISSQATQPHKPYLQRRNEGDISYFLRVKSNARPGRYGMFFSSIVIVIQW